MLSGVVLAGGTGSRMGGDKGLVDVCSRPMVLHIADVVSRVADEVVVSVAKGCADRYRERLGADVSVVEDRESGRGPLEGLRRSFETVGGEYVVVTPCDVLLLKEEILQTLCARAIGYDGAVPVVRGYLEPLVAVYGRDAGRAAFEQGLEAGKCKVGDAISHLRLRRVAEDEITLIDPDLESFWNVNTPDDLRRATASMRCRNSSGR